MSDLSTIETSQESSSIMSTPKDRGPVFGSDPSVFTDIYNEKNNIVVWRRELSNTLKSSVQQFIEADPTFRTSMTVTPDSVFSSICDVMGKNAVPELGEHIAELVDMFCCLFELKRTGLRLAVLNRAMCPRFHVDRVPCRLVSTFQGVATEWLPHQVVNRAYLGKGAGNLSDCKSGLYKAAGDIQQLGCGDVALLKGESWDGNENAGLVHRSPYITDESLRLLLTLDFS